MKTQDVKLYAAQQLHRLQALPDNQRRAELAKLRRGIGHAPGELPELWGSFLLGMPESFQGRSAPSAAEWAVYLALTLYAVHQQGNDRPMNCPGNTLGRAVRQLAERNSAGQDWTEASVLRRFNALATAEEITEISHHLRGMIQLLSAAKDGAIPLDYPQLAADLYELQCTDPRYVQTPANVRLRWGQDLYRDPKPAPEGERKGELIMNKRLYVDFHILQTVPPSCINRDDTGSPKTAVYGGVLRARVSSQAWKHAMRAAFAENAQLDVGKRTKKAAELVKEQILVLDPEQKKADKMAKEALKYVGIKSDDKKGTDALIFISSAQAKALAELVVGGCTKDEEYEEALIENPSADMVLFGRMVAQKASLKYDAAAQVAHSISTHAVQNEYDYFTAVDDCQVEDNAGAGHLGTVEYNSSTLYRYATVNVMELAGRLGAAQAAETVRAFGEAFLFSMPTGKQNTFANRTLPDAVYVTLREDQPVNLCGAFERAVPRSAQGYAAPSKAALAQYAQQMYSSFAEAPAQSFTVGSGLEELAPAQTAKAMLDALEKAVRDALAGNEVG